MESRWANAAIITKVPVTDRFFAFRDFEFNHVGSLI